MVLEVVAVQLWNLISAGLVLGVSIIVAFVLSKIITRYLAKIAAKTETKLDDYAMKI